MRRGAMRVLHVIPFVALRHGGSTHAIRKITSACVEFASRVTVLTGESLGQEGILEGFHPAVEVVSKPGPIAKLERVSFGTLSYLADAHNHFDLIHVHTQFNFTASAASWVGKLANLPVIIRPTGTLDPWCLAYKAWKKRPYFRLFIKPALRWASAIHVTSEHERASIEGLGFGQKAHILPLCAEPVTSNFRWSPVQEPKEILFMSRWDTVKNIPNLLRAFQVFHRAHKDVRLVLAGSGHPQLTHEIHSLIAELGISDYVDTPGFLSGSQKEEAFERASLFVLPSFQENFGIAAIEALARGVPLLMSDGLALSRECRDYDAATLINPESLNSLVEGIAEIFQPARMISHSRNGKALVSDLFAVEKMTSGLSELYSKVLSSRNVR